MVFVAAGFDDMSAHGKRSAAAVDNAATRKQRRLQEFFFDVGRGHLFQYCYDVRPSPWWTVEHYCHMPGGESPLLPIGRTARKRKNRAARASGVCECVDVDDLVEPDALKL